MEIVKIEQIPDDVILSNGLRVNLRLRLLSYMIGKACPVGGYYLHDVLSWINWEGIKNLRDYCQF